MRIVPTTGIALPISLWVGFHPGRLALGAPFVSSGKSPRCSDQRSAHSSELQRQLFFLKGIVLKFEVIF